MPQKLFLFDFLVVFDKHKKLIWHINAILSSSVYNNNPWVCIAEYSKCSYSVLILTGVEFVCYLIQHLSFPSAEYHVSCVLIENMFFSSWGPFVDTLHRRVINRLCHMSSKTNSTVDGMKWQLFHILVTSPKERPSP